jgi:hypothetical protein
MTEQEIYTLLKTLPQWATEDTLSLLASGEESRVRNNLQEINRVAKKLGLDDLVKTTDELIKRTQAQKSKARRTAEQLRREARKINVNAVDPVSGIAGAVTTAGNVFGAVGGGMRDISKKIPIKHVRSLLGFAGGSLQMGGKGAAALAAFGGALSPIIIAQEKQARALIDFGMVTNDSLEAFSLLRRTSAELGMSITEIIESQAQFSSLIANMGGGLVADGVMRMAQFVKAMDGDSQFSRFGHNLSDFNLRLLQEANLLFQSGSITELNMHSKRRIGESYTTASKFALFLAGISGENRESIIQQGLEAMGNADNNAALLRNRDKMDEIFGKGAADVANINLRQTTQFFKAIFPSLASANDETITKYLNDINLTQEVGYQMSGELQELFKILGPESLELYRDIIKGIPTDSSEGNTLKMIQLAKIIKNNRENLTGGNDEVLKAARKVRAEAQYNFTDDLDNISNITEIKTMLDNTETASDKADDMITSMDNVRIGFRKTFDRVIPGFETMGALFSPISTGTLELIETIESVTDIVFGSAEGQARRTELKDHLQKLPGREKNLSKVTFDKIEELEAEKLKFLEERSKLINEAIKHNANGDVEMEKAALDRAEKAEDEMKKLDQRIRLEALSFHQKLISIRTTGAMSEVTQSIIKDQTDLEVEQLFGKYLKEGDIVPVAPPVVKPGVQPDRTPEVETGEVSTGFEHIVPQTHIVPDDIKAKEDLGDGITPNTITETIKEVLIAGLPIEEGKPFTEDQITALMAKQLIQPNEWYKNYPEWVQKQFKEQREQGTVNGTPIAEYKEPIVRPKLRPDNLTMPEGHYEGDGHDHGEVTGLEYGVNLNPNMSPLTTLSGSSYMTNPNAANNMSDLLDNEYQFLQMYFGDKVLINDAIAKQGTSRETKTPGSQHFQGTALDLSTAGMNDQEKLDLIRSAQDAGFTGFGLGRNILHVDTGPARTWSYGNDSYGGLDIADAKKMALTPNTYNYPADTKLGISERLKARLADAEALLALKTQERDNNWLPDFSLNSEINELDVEIARYQKQLNAILNQANNEELIDAN